MRLTNYIRDAFVASAMNDVPSVDYEEIIRSRVNAMAAEFIKKAGIPTNVDINRLDNNYLYGMGPGRSMYVRGLLVSEQESIKADPQIKAWAALEATQAEARRTLEAELEGVAASVTSSQKLIELLPEFEKYLPAEPIKPSNLPAISNMMGDFIRAGWPKAKTVAAGAAA